MNRLTAIAAMLLLAVFVLFPSRAQAEEWRWCAAVDHNDNGFPYGPFMVTYPFRADGAPDYAARYEDHARSIMGSLLGEFMLNCSSASDTLAAAVADRSDWVSRFDGLPIETMDVDWTPGGSGYSSANGDNRRTLDSTGAEGGRAYCMLQETVDGQPRALFSLVFSPPELQGAHDSSLENSFIRYAQSVHAAQPDATATCHRHDTEAGAHDMRNHDAEMRRIKGWTVVMTHWSH